ncbi:MAG: NADH-quinone oxidoreductase subunit NuoH [candidate division KSB1 bacterium]|nr:NADH-quinone oxidoreductase subunit NuoH [candidate division KSB1 bacterium]MDZ7366914.1 NADH-quinone oxidoreductase subunit NuoH [candidate division KSB1 bacterium]MDZ7406083.1 NADH-quinone oxidoreductase subunit NuoH [candidate division KSB1 bacterium]
MRELIETLQSGQSFLAGLPPAVLTLIFLVIAAAFFATVMALNALVMVYAERKVSAWMQDRMGPMEVGPRGMLQTLADAVKLLIKEDIVPAAADKRLHWFAPFLAFAAPCAAFAALPYARNFVFANFDIGVFYVASITSLSVIAILMAGWASNNKWALLGGMRAAAQIVSYEIPAGLAIIVIVMQVGSLNFNDISLAQDGGIHRWFMWRYFPFNLIAFVVFYLATLAECNRTPFDLPEAESELVAGFHTEYSGFKWSIFMLAEYAEMLIVALVGAALFLGGWSSPIPGFLNSGAWGVLWFALKGLFLIFTQMWLRWTLPRLRVDQLMHLSWKVLTPFSFACVLGVGLWMLF